MVALTAVAPDLLVLVAGMKGNNHGCCLIKHATKISVRLLPGAGGRCSAGLLPRNASDAATTFITVVAVVAGDRQCAHCRLQQYDGDKGH